jgi:hypothetical protein
MLSNLPKRRDEEVGLVSIGSGIGGLSAASTVSERGAQALVLRLAGGLTRLWWPREVMLTWGLVHGDDSSRASIARFSQSF